jgi:AraC-like DNA-binding protein
MAASETAKRPSAINAMAGQLRPLIDMAGKAGVETGPLLSAAGLPRDFLSLPLGAAVPLTAYFRLMHEIAIALGDETLALSPRPHLPGTMDFVLSHLHGANSLYEAMKAVASYYNLLHGGEYNSVRRKGDLVTFVIDDRRFPYTSSDRDYVQFSMECVQIFVHCMLATIAPGRPERALRSVGVTRERAAIKTGHLSFWLAPVKFGAPVFTLSYDAADALAPLAIERPEELTADRVYGRVDEMIRSREKTSETAGGLDATIRAYLRQGIVDQREIAERVGVSVATLRRRLAEEGASFRELRKDELNGAAQRLLRKRLPIADIAEELGFSEFRSFNRAFKEWNGKTPKAFLKELEADRRT